jgi:hypothetical protein
MERVTLTLASSDDIDVRIAAFYQRVLEALNSSGLPFLVGGAYAFNCHTRINRYTKDLDIFIYRHDYERVSKALLDAGYETELTYPHWLAKVRSDGVFIDIIFSSGNGIAEVDQIWFDHARDAEVLGIPARICPPEEMIWSKAFIMERERYDGADIAHLLHACASELDWQRLLWRFDPHWRVLLSHLILFGFVYPAHRTMIPAWLMDDLLERLRQETHGVPPASHVCSGTLLSREQYLIDIEQLGYQDSRLTPIGNMSPEDTVHWTNAIPGRQPPA